jgi:uncharacterized protein involved in exopolysaccharide biosynthesis
MIARKSLIGHVTEMRVLRSALWRRTLLGASLAACAALALFPQPYLAVTTATPTDPTSLGLSGTLGQLGAVQSVFGNQAGLEVSMRVADSDYVRNPVADKVGLDKRLGKNRTDTLRWLERNVDVRSLRGGIIQIDIKLHDRELARSIIAAYGEAVRERLSEISRRQTAYKRSVLVDLVNQASKDLANAQSAYDEFRLRSRYSSPQASILAIGERVPILEDAIKTKQVDLNAARQFFTDDNLVIREILAQIDALNKQLAIARSTSPDQPNSVGRVVQASTEVSRLKRNLDLAEKLYDSYSRYLQGTAVENQTSSANIRILEPAYVSSERQFNMTFVVLGVMILLFGAAMEFYLLRPFLSSRGAI